MSYPERQIREERDEVKEEPPILPQVATMCELIVSRLNEQDKLLQILKDKLAPVLAPALKSADDGANKVENPMVPLAEGMRNIGKKIALHNAWIDSMIEGIQL